MNIHQWIRSFCFIVIAFSSIMFVYCQWQNVKAQRAQAVAISGFYNNSTKVLLEAMFMEEGMGKTLDSIYSLNAKKLLENIQRR